MSSTSSLPLSISLSLSLIFFSLSLSIYLFISISLSLFLSISLCLFLYLSLILPLSRSLFVWYISESNVQSDPFDVWKINSIPLFLFLPRGSKEQRHVSTLFTKCSNDTWELKKCARVVYKTSKVIREGGGSRSILHHSIHSSSEANVFQKKKNKNFIGNITLQHQTQQKTQVAFATISLIIHQH